MSMDSKVRHQLLCAWSGLAFALLYPICWAWLGHTRPALSPTLSAEQVASFYTLHRGDILIGMTAAAVIGALWVPWTAQLTVVLRRIEGNEPVLTIVQAIGGALTAWVLVFTPAMWAAAAWRQGADPDSVRVLSDIAYLTFTLTYSITAVQIVAAGLICLADDRTDPVFPRWVGWVSMLTGLSFLLVSCLPFFQTGPLAMDGIVVSGVPGSAYFVWTIATAIYLLKDARRFRSRAELAPG